MFTEIPKVMPKARLEGVIVSEMVIPKPMFEIIVGVTKDLTSSIKAGELISVIAEQVGGKGGGRADMAQAGGNNVKALPKALSLVKDWVAEKL